MYLYILICLAICIREKKGIFREKGGLIEEKNLMNKYVESFNLAPTQFSYLHGSYRKS